MIQIKTFIISRISVQGVKYLSSAKERI